MSTINFKDADALSAQISEEFGDWSNQIAISQDDINAFAELTGDHMWMHVDVERCAKESPFGTTIVHGFLLLSSLPKLQSAPECISQISGFSHMMNYGSDKLRFLGAVPVDTSIHARSRIKAVDVSESKTKVTMETHVHIVDQERPALIYEIAFVYM
ncbi:MAG: MaoC family dehydratase [Pseudomonadota bacterium]